MNIVITGDSGFIGSYLTKALLLHGHQVFGIDLNAEKKYDVRYPYIVGDILDAVTLEKIPNGVDGIIHLAAAHKDFGISREEYYRVNVDGMRSVLRFAGERNINKIIFYSTVAVYGMNQPSTETTSPNPVNHYGGSKLEAEHALEEWIRGDGKRQGIIIRPTVVFGPLNVANIFKLIKQVCDGKFYWVGDGKNIKSIAYVENLVEATCFLLDRMVPGCAVYNYSDEPHMETRELVEMIARIAGKKVPTTHLPLGLALAAARLIDVLGTIIRYDFPITAARLNKFNTSTEHRSKKIRDLGFRSSHSIEEGIRKNVQWYFESYQHLPTKIESSGE